ncbi:MAG TPA: RNA polymerase sigma factor [Ktedonobacterales bacterium]
MSGNSHAPAQPTLTGAIASDPRVSQSARPARPARAMLADDVSGLLAAARPRLARLARLNGATADLAEDVAQETLLTAWRSLDRLREADRFDAWLDGICRNICRRVARSVAAERERLLEASAPSASEEDDMPPSALDGIVASDGDPLDELTRQELATLLDSALGYLNLAAREAVSLRYLADLPTEEAAARLGLTINALEARLSRARKQLRAALNGPLRERAVAFGLALAPADEVGWRETSIWCHFCGQARMRGILTDVPDGGGSLTLRCPLCWRDYGVTETHTPSMRELAGVTSFRPALKRVLEHSVMWNASTQRLEATCFGCGRPLPVRMGRLADFPALSVNSPLYSEHYSAIYECVTCGSFGSGVAALAGRTHPLVWRFLLGRRRWVVEPDRLVEYRGAPAIRFTLHDLGADERITYFSDPTTLTVRDVIES